MDYILDLDNLKKAQHYLVHRGRTLLNRKENVMDLGNGIGEVEEGEVVADEQSAGFPVPAARVMAISSSSLDCERSDSRRYSDSRASRKRERPSSLARRAAHLARARSASEAARRRSCSASSTKVSKRSVTR